MTNVALTVNGPTLRDALYELSMDKRLPDAQVLNDVVRRYPQFTEELVDCSVELALDALRPVGVVRAAEVVNISPAVSRAMSRFRRLVNRKPS